MVLAAAFNILLAKLSGEEEIIIGIPVAGRRHSDLEKMMGMFVNTLALRNFPVSQKIFTQFLEEVKESTIQAFENQDYLYQDLVEQVEMERDTGRNPLFDTMFVLQNMETVKIEIPGLDVQPFDYETQVSKFDLTLTAVESGEKLVFALEYCTKLFKEETIQRFVGFFKKTILTIVENHEIKISEMEIINAEEKNQQLYEFNDTKAEYPRDKTIHQLFEEKVERIPDHTALLGQIPNPQSPIPDKEAAFGGGHLSYKELNEKSNQLAYLLKEKGVGADTIVGIMAARSVEMIIGILGILKAGGAYLPIDPEYPKERVRYILADSETQLLLTQKKVEKRIEVGCDAEIELINLEDNALYAGDKATLPGINRPGHLAYIIYTSGSTGRPKGVLIRHGSVVNVLTALFKRYPFSSRDTYLLKTSYTFDVSVTELFGWFLGGGRLAILKLKGERDPEEILETIEGSAISHINFVPSMFGVFLEILNGENLTQLSSLKYIFLAGEVLSPVLVKRLMRFNSGVLLENIYGPTESTIYASSYSLSGWKGSGNIPIGKPLPNIGLYILDKYAHLQPVGVAGELCISGPGLALGYLNQPGLTEEKFVSSPFPLLRGERLYRTGDLARWLLDGNIEFLGRLDQQVKIRGFRIELGEIENQLLKHEAIREAVILAKDDERGDKYLAAYIVPGGTPLPGLREYLLKFLPDYMVPSYFMPLDEVPLTPTGKIDRSALPSPGIGAGEKYTAPGDEVERRLADIWEEVLPLSAAIGIDGNFFQLGGHSLKAMTLLAKVHQAFNVKLALSEMFKRPSIRRLSQYIRDAIEEQYMSIEAAEKKEYYALSSAQQRLYFLQQMDEAGMAYNMPSVWVMKGDVDQARMADTFSQLIQRHESFRTSFIMVDDKPAQRIHDEVEFEIEYDQSLVHCQGRGEVPSPIKVEKIIRNFIRPFDLSETPLLRVGLVLLKEQKHLLMVDMHHIISDGMSVGILVQDFVALYSWDTLPVIRIHYKDYTVWQSREKERERIREQGEYWEQEFEGEIPIFEFPIDYARPSIQIFEGNSINFEISSETTGALKALTLESGTTLYMVLVAIYHVFLSKISSQEDIVVGTPVSGHRHADLEKIIGMFVNTLALRNYPSGEKKFTDFLEEVKEKTLKAFDNQDYPYEDLVEQVSVTRDTSRNPLFDTMFVLQNAGIQTLEIPGLNLVPYEYENKTSKFDLTLTGIESGEKMLFTFEYSIKLFKRETIERFIVFFMKVVKGIIENKHRKISEIEIIPDEEKTQVLVDFNSTTADYPKDKTIHALFEEQAERTSDHVALIGKNSKHEGTRGLAPLSITYRQLNKKSTRLADVLREKGAKPGTIVGIMLERSVEMIIGILGILKADGAYLPIDPEYPEERKQYMLDDSDAGVLITRPDLSGKHKKLKIVNGQLSIVNCQRQISRTFEAKKDHLHLSPAPATCLAYILYTSGSTGRPKGVLIRHGSVVNVLTALFKRYPFCSGDTYLLKTSYTFDVSVTELFGWFLGGGRLAILKLKGERDPGDILETIERCAISHINFVPSMFGVFLETLNGENLTRLSSLKYIFLAGEALLPVLVKRLMRFNSGVLLENIYGPTESTIYASNYSLSGWKGSGNIPIGKPLPNIGLYILDKYDHLQPVGVAGELCISGQGLAVGYLNQPGLTEEKFVFSPFLRGERLYRTGDLARWLSDGNIEFLGRLDQQVKVRGFRIELGEIENQLLNHDEVREAVVSVKNDKREDKYLFAYIVSHSPGSFESNRLRSYLQEKLPGYMVPVYFVELEEMPLTAGGKIDKRSLPEPGITPGRGYIAPRNASEELLVNIWIEVLAIDNAQIGIDDNFFELGGNSLKAIRLISKIHKEFNREIPLRE
ncbi:MAG: amino acid adenylation domain-containing protein, partial [Candidatus Aminicenantes bacterium]